MGWSAYRPTGLTFHNPNLSFKGYTLLTVTQRDEAFLIDMSGRVVGHWQFDRIHPQFAQLLPGGIMLVMGTSKESKARYRQADAAEVAANLDLHVQGLGGSCNMIQEFDLDGNLVWELQREYMHHELIPTQNDTFLTLEYVPLADEFSRKIRGGVRERSSVPMMGDDVVEFDREGREVSRVSTWKFMDPRKDRINPLQNRREWSHANSVDLLPNGNVVVSCRHNSRVLILDRENEALVWKSKAGEFSLQHHATSVPEGRLQVFDNGESRPLSLTYSRIVEIDPKNDEVTWQYVARPMSQFYTGHMGAAQRLPLGNVLITEGVTGRVFEISRQCEVVWEWITPFNAGSPDGTIRNWIYRAFRYSLDHAAFQDRDLNPAAYAHINEGHGLR